MLFFLFLLATAAAAPPDYDNFEPVNVETGPWEVQADDSSGLFSRFTGLLGKIGKGFGGLSPAGWNWDKETVYEGIFKNENIMIHVGQNMFNFVMTTLAWFFVSQLFFKGEVAADAPRGGRSFSTRSLVDAAEEVIMAVEKFEKKYR